MFTQCPECQIAFRVTARVLQQAGGNVRCGNCGHAFNALHFLSEDMPEQPPPAANDSGDDDSIDTSRQALETLDELTGPDDVRIEDTGVEWRVLADGIDDDNGPELSQPAIEELRFDDNTPLPDDFDDGVAVAAPSAPQRRETDIGRRSDEFEDRQGDLALSDPEDWTDILDEFRDPDAESLEVEEEMAAIHSQLSARSVDTTISAAADGDDGDADETPRSAADDDVWRPAAEAGEEESLMAAGDMDEDDLEALFGSAAAADEVDIELQPSPDTPDEAVADVFALAGDDDVDGETLSIVVDGGDDDADDDSDRGELYLVGEDEADVASGAFEHVVPEPTEEEMTVNMEIDEELLAAARQDIDFTATLVGIEDPEQIFERNPAEVETIIMEGEIIRTAVEKERLAAEDEARNQLDDPSRLADTYALTREKLRGGRRRYDPPSYVIGAAIAVLSVTLLGQVIHNSRQSLATYGFFNQTIAPVYRMLGNPVKPEWDIKGWQFEATSGNVDAEETALTIVSRIANRSSQPLPYPLIHISLTNRFEDIMGSRILEPGEYLAGDLDPSRPVVPGEDFTAVITIENPSAEATGFKLNVCYRVEPGTVRCAIEDFKN